MALSSHAKTLIEAGSLDEVEAQWMSSMESESEPVEEYLETAKLLRHANERSRADALLELLGDSLRERGAWAGRLRVLKELGRLSKRPANLRPLFEEALTRLFGERSNFKRVMQHAQFSESSSNPVERAEKVETWLTFDEGEIFLMTGRGVGIVTELNPELGICRLDFEKEKRVAVPLGAAQKFLMPIRPDHLLREKITNPEKIRAEAKSSPQAFFEALLRGFGKPMTASEAKDALIGIVPDERWSSWWASARKHPQIVVTGPGAKATYAWSHSADHAEQSVRKEFEQAPVREKLELARKHSSRSREIADFMSEALARETETLSKTEPALAWEIDAVLQKLPGTYEPRIKANELLTGPLAARIVAGIPDRLLREKALKTIREEHPDWAKVYSEVFFTDDDLRILTLIVSALEQGDRADIRDRLIDETLRYPRRHPRAFHWIVKRMADADPLPDRANYALLFQILDALTNDEFSALRARLREFFDKGRLAIRIIMSSTDEDQAQKLFTTIDRYGALEEYRRETVKAAVLMKFPKLREPQLEPVYATPEMLSAKRDELEHLRRVEIPANSKALQAAREMGDLRENFEYKAARQRAEYLAARAGELQSELSRVRVLEPNQIDVSQVRIGTKVELSNGDVRREVTILGPWESAPERGVYSNQSDVARTMMGHAVGDIVSFMGNDYRIESIARWK